MNQLAVFIKTNLLKAGKQQAEIAKELGISYSAVTQFISGQRKSKRFDAWILLNLDIDMSQLRKGIEKELNRTRNER